ncbi:hypothetical protein DYQ05_09285 [Treponema pedis]|uniref:Uncharacterized protein n=1 Tax=Treponema pedis TaxID=409322 RepID=A0A7S7AYI1_9SPIR|nr:hypothetical protein IFE08_07485 [Treponema pedis]QSI05092.1 hypothetical protein DYQ05_09285 [Treponema pedis]
MSTLTSGACPKNPEGSNHVPYEGDEKQQYTCKYCGQKAFSIKSLTSGICTKSPHKRHHPAL